MKVAVYDVSGKKVKDIELEPSVFEVEVSEALVHQVVTAQLAGVRAGTASTKTRSEVRGGGRKPWRQKGTGRARAGSRRSPIWRGGGIIFGPKPRDYSQKVPRKMYRSALRAVLSSKARGAELLVVDGFGFTRPATRKAKEVLANIKAPSKVTVVLPDGEESTEKSIRNLPGATVLYASEVNPFELLDNKAVIFTQDALDKVTEVLRA